MGAGCGLVKFGATVPGLGLYRSWADAVAATRMQNKGRLPQMFRTNLPALTGAAAAGTRS